MNRLTLLLTIFTCSILTMHSQEERFLSVLFNFDYKFKTDTYVKLYVPEEGKVFIYESFFTAPNLNDKKTKVAYPLSKKDNKSTSVAKLEGRIFKIVDILKPGEEGRVYDMLVLEATDTGEKLYYHNKYSTSTFLVDDPDLHEALKEEKKQLLKDNEERLNSKIRFKRDDFDEYKQVDLGANKRFYKNCTMIVNQFARENIVFSFYFNKEDVYKPLSATHPSFNKITKGTFKVNDIFTNDVFELQDIETGETLYYKYNQSQFPFLVKDLQFTEEAGESHLWRTVDDFTKEVRISSPDGPVNVTKLIDKNKSSYYMNLETVGVTLNVGEKGVKVLFDDGSVWSRNEEVKVDTSKDYNWKYSSFITLNAADLKTFSTKKIKKFELYIYQQSIPDELAEIYRIYFKLIQTAK